MPIWIVTIKCMNINTWTVTSSMQLCSFLLSSSNFGLLCSPDLLLSVLALLPLFSAHLLLLIQTHLISECEWGQCEGRGWEYITKGESKEGEGKCRKMKLSSFLLMKRAHNLTNLKAHATLVNGKEFQNCYCTARLNQYKGYLAYCNSALRHHSS